MRVQTWFKGFRLESGLGIRVGTVKVRVRVEGGVRLKKRAGLHPEGVACGAQGQVKSYQTPLNIKHTYKKILKQDIKKMPVRL